MSARHRTRSKIDERSSYVDYTGHFHHIWFDYDIDSHGDKYFLDKLRIWKKSETIDDVTGSRKFRPNKFRPWENPIHDCTHTKKEALYDEAPMPVHNWYLNPGWTETNRYDHYPSKLDYAYWKAGYDPSLSPTFGDSLNSSGEYESIDWGMLMDSFGEACDSLVPQAFFFGEDSVESGIWLDAIKVLINPSRAVQTTVKWLRRFGRDKQTHRLLTGVIGRSKHSDLSEIGRSFQRKRLLKGKRYTGLTLGDIPNILAQVANGDLLYKFAVKPAIDDIKATLNAHSLVEKRLRFIESHRGTFVPIRVGRKFNSTISDFSHPDQLYASPQIYSAITAKSVIGTISAWGKVRSDITVQPRWAAYTEYFGLNKIVGTAWELIPFSFVVDWFTNAQEKVNSMTRLRVSDPYTEIRNICYSIKKVTERRRFLQLPLVDGVSSVINPQSPVTMMRYRDSSFQRSNTFPGNDSFFQFSKLGLGKTLSLGELGLQYLVSRKGKL